MMILSLILRLHWHIFVGQHGQPSLFDSVNSHKTELNQASIVCTAGPAQFGSARFGPLL